MNDILKCELCGKVIMILEEGGRRTICCDQLMVRLPEQFDKSNKGSHSVHIEELPEGIRVRAGDVNTSRKERHAFEWIEATDGKNVLIKRLSPGEQPVAEFQITGPLIKALAYCPNHGIWSSNPQAPQP